MFFWSTYPSWSLGNSYAASVCIPDSFSGNYSSYGKCCHRNYITTIVACYIMYHSQKFEGYVKPFAESYKEEMSYWSGIELTRRFLFLLALVPFPRNTVNDLL